ncbi:ig, and/or I-set domain containing protein, partial [Asbolus verrucosus]
PNKATFYFHSKFELRSLIRRRYCQANYERDPFDGSVVLFPEALAEIQGAPDLYMRAGSSLRLVCTLRHSTEPPAFVFWYHEQRMINYDPGVTVKESRSSSVLLLQDADKSHNGNYTCSPSNAVPASINVHVLNATAVQ